jgi:hypothetical protein
LSTRHFRSEVVQNHHLLKSDFKDELRLKESIRPASVTGDFKANVGFTVIHIRPWSCNQFNAGLH